MGIFVTKVNDIDAAVVSLVRMTSHRVSTTEVTIRIRSALDVSWPLGRGQNQINMCKRENLEWLRFYNNRFGAGCIMATGDGAKPGKYVQRRKSGVAQIL